MGSFLLSPSSYCIAMRLLCQIALGDGSFINDLTFLWDFSPESQGTKGLGHGKRHRCDRRDCAGSFDLNRIKMNVC